MTGDSKMHKLRWNARVRAHAREGVCTEMFGKEVMRSFMDFGLRAQRVGLGGSFDFEAWIFCLLGATFHKSVNICKQLSPSSTC